MGQLCLVDKGSGAYFWYNTRDESTQWADTSYSGQAEATTTYAEAKEPENVGIAFASDDLNEETKEEPPAESKELPIESSKLDSKQESKKGISDLNEETKEEPPAEMKELPRDASKLDYKQESKKDLSSSNKENAESDSPAPAETQSMKKAKSAEKVLDEPPSISPRLATSKSAVSLQE